jgi:hypothetical protein
MFKTEFETRVYLVVYEKAEFNPDRHPLFFSCQSYTHMKNRWTGEEGTGSAHVQVIDVTTDRINIPHTVIFVGVPVLYVL